MRFTTWDGISLSYEVEGDGPPVLLLHGFAADSYINWVRPRIVPALVEAGFCAVALDQRGHGASDKPHDPGAYADDAMLSDAIALIDHLELDALFCAGYSMGAGVTLRLLPRDDRVRVAVLGGIGGSMLKRRERGAIADALTAEDPSEVGDRVSRSFRDFADLTGADKEALAAISRSGFPAAEALDEIAVPVLVVCGDNDPLVGSPQELAEAIPGARAAVVGGTHLNVVNNPDFHRELLGFLSEHRAAVGGVG